ncbi:transglutaminase-like domain-containing protein [Desulfogranum japonicum]|uniref:transglutaminase-like domain-containing protein n=1 Tax=Desulfogranum japonicum TaxID=231447 RepID=UPI0004116EC3|nr:transglutaminase family protein [Desulfogranum japonicum]
MKAYLESSKYIDWHHPEIVQQAQDLAVQCSSNEEIAESCFVFVRDHIQHSKDYERNPVTVKASEVLQHRTGYCYAKSHLLAALLRANHIPAGLCYQRLTVEPDGSLFCLHGLNGVFLEQYGWYRVDARGNKPGVDAQFCPPREQLAFSLDSVGECNIQGVWPQPLPVVIEVLEQSETYLEVFHNLPDVAIGEWGE